MKKFGTALAIIFIAAALCLFFLVGRNLSGEWWPYAVGSALLLIGAAFAAVSDVFNMGTQRRAEEKTKRDEGIKEMKTTLSEKLAREKAERDERLKNIHNNANNAGR